MILVLMGAPGAGKGTQADYLKGKGFQKVSTGDLFRKEIAQCSELGQLVEAVIRRGDLVSDDVLFEILKKELNSIHNRNLVLDGFPRTVPQAEWLEENTEVSGVVHIDASSSELLNRMRGRRSCLKCGAVYHILHKPPQKAELCDKCGSELKTRADDGDESVLLNRLETYELQTQPVLDFYKKRRQYFRIDGNLEQSAVSSQLDTLLNRLNRADGQA